MDSMNNADPDNTDTINELREMNEVCITAGDQNRTAFQLVYFLASKKRCPDNDNSSETSADS